MDRRLFGIVWTLQAVVTFFSSSASAQPIGPQQAGFVTFYGAPSPPSVAVQALSPVPAPAGGLVSGACGYGQLNGADWPYNQVVSLGPNNSIATGIGSNKLGCGQCIQATCTSASCAANASEGVLLWVTDGCPQCANDQLNVPAATFQSYFGSSLALGKVAVSYQQVDCDPPGIINVKVVDANASGAGYIALTFFSLAGSGELEGVDIRTSGSTTWAPMSNIYGSVWAAANFGAPPLDLRITNFQGDALTAKGVITRINQTTFSTNVQFGIPAPSQAPSTTAQAPSTSLQLPLTATPSTTYQYASAPEASAGVPIPVPLYYPPPTDDTPQTYPGTVFSYIECFDGTPILNLTVNQLMVPSADGTAKLAYAIHSFDYGSVHSTGDTPFYKLVDFSFFNLETGEYVQLYETEYVTFDNTSYDGTIPADDYDAADTVTVYPIYVDPSSLQGPSDFKYSILLPPGANEAPTAAYLKTLQAMYYYLATLTLGDSGARSDYVTCSQGYSQVGPWADYMRNIIAQLAPADEVSGDLFNNIPLGPSYGFQDTSFVIDNALIAGNVLTMSMQNTSQACGMSCRPDTPQVRFATLCSAWAWCGSISGCGNVTYQTCELKNSTAQSNTTAPDGFLNFVQGGVRYTSGVLSLPPPTGMSLFDFAANDSGIGYGLMTNVAVGPALAP